jgi:hypothetical protein
MVLELVLGDNVYELVWGIAEASKGLQGLNCERGEMSMPAFCFHFRIRILRLETAANRPLLHT